MTECDGWHARLRKRLITAAVVNFVEYKPSPGYARLSAVGDINRWLTNTGLFSVLMKNEREKEAINVFQSVHLIVQEVWF